MQNDGTERLTRLKIVLYVSAALSLASALLACGNASNEWSPASIRDSAGVQIVENAEIVECAQRQAGHADSCAIGAPMRIDVHEFHFDAGTRALYATDASNYRQVPIGIVIPRSVHDVVQTVAICRQFGAPLLSRAGGTSRSPTADPARRCQ